jgi:uncharacterized protein YegP (UPF0339 family)
MADKPHFQMHKSADGRFFWGLAEGSDRLIAASVEMYGTQAGWLEIIQWIQTRSASMPVYDHTAEAPDS